MEGGAVQWIKTEKADTPSGCRTMCGKRWTHSISWIIVLLATSLWRRRCGSIAVVCTPPRALQEMLEGTLGVFGDRLGKLLFKLVVEHNMTNHLLGGDIDMTRDEYNKMRGNSVREVAGTHGSISFRDVLLFHREE